MTTSLEMSLKSAFGPMDSDLLQSITHYFKPETLSKGDFFLKKYQYGNRLSFLQSGLLRIFDTYDTKEVTQWISTPGYFVTDLNSFMFNQRARWQIQALTDCTLMTIYKDDYFLLKSTTPQWYELEKLFIAHCFTNLEDRIFSHLSLTAEERFQQFYKYNSELFNLVPLQYIASMLGMTPETLSRIRKKLSQNIS